MVYTVVSRGRVLGTTEFEFAGCREGSRGGSFWPAEGVEHLMEIAVGVSPAIVTAVKANAFDPPDDHDARTRAARVARLKGTTEHADVASAEDRLETLELELRAPNGSLIETEWIGLQDTEFLLSLADADIERELDEELADDFTEPSTEDLDDIERDLVGEREEWSNDFDSEWPGQPEKPFPRYQIFVQLIDDADVP